MYIEANAKTWRTRALAEIFFIVCLHGSFNILWPVTTKRPFWVENIFRMEPKYFERAAPKSIIGISVTRLSFYFFYIWPFTTKNIYPISYLGRFKILPNTKLTLKNLPKTLIFLPKWQNVSDSGCTDLGRECCFKILRIFGTILWQVFALFLQE